jgi:hypothetical protein
MRKQLARAKKEAEETGQFVPEVRAKAKALYLDPATGRKSPGVDDEDIESLLDTGEPPQMGYPGQLVGADKFFSTAGTLVSPISGLAFGGLSANADVLGLSGKTMDERLKWVNKLHPDDPRKNLLWNISEGLAARERGATFKESALLEANTTALATLYALPGLDQFGMQSGRNQLPRTWQEIDDTGAVVGGPTATTIDILTRGLAGRAVYSSGPEKLLSSGSLGRALGLVEMIPGLEGIDETIIRNQDAIAKAISEKVRGAAEFAEVPFETAFAALNPFIEEGAMEALERSTEEAKKVWRGDADADPYQGSFLPSLVFTLSPDVGFDILTRSRFLFEGGRGAVRTQGGVLTRHGDSTLRANEAKAAEKVSREFSKLSAQQAMLADAGEDALQYTARDLGAQLDMAKSQVGQAYANLGAKFQKAADSHVTDVDIADAVSLTRADDGALSVVLDESKVRVLMSDDPIVLGAKKADATRLLGPEDAKRVEDLVERLKKSGVSNPSQARIFAELEKSGFSRRVALAGGIGFGAGVMASDEEEFGNKLLDGAQTSLGAIAGSAILFGGGQTIGRVVDSAGRGVARIHFKPGTVSAEGVTQGYRPPILGDVPEQIRKRVPGLKNLNPWTQQKVIGKKVGDDFVTETVVEPIKAADLLSSHIYARRAFLDRSKRYSEKKLKSEMQQSILSVLWKLNTSPREREVVLDLVESMGSGESLEDLGTTLVYKFRKHLEKSLQYIPEEISDPKKIKALKKQIAEELDPKKKAQLKKKRKKLKKAAKLDDELKEATKQVRELLGEDPFGKMAGMTLGQAVRSTSEKAEVISSIMEQVLGVSDADAYRAARRSMKELKAFMTDSSKKVSDEKFMKAIDKIGAREARDVAAVVRKNAYKNDPRYQGLSQAGKDAVEGARNFFSDVRDLLIAEGKLSRSKSLEQFMFEMDVGGYIPHMLRNGDNVAKVKSRVASKYKVPLSALSDVTGSLKGRTLVGSVSQINQQQRRKVAEMIYRSLVKQETDKPLSKRMTDEFLDEKVQEYGLADFKFFETDAWNVMQSYSSNVSRALSNKRYLENIQGMFPESERFAALAARDRLAGDMEALKAGFRRVNGVVHLRALMGKDPWDGFKKYKNEINTYLTDQGLNRAGRAQKLKALFDAQGVDMRDPEKVRMVEVMASDLYLPNAFADMFEMSAAEAPQWLRGGEGVGGYALGSWDAVTNYFKSITTVLAPAFHGRNYLSNVVTNLMTHGTAAVSPKNQIDSIFLMRADPDKVYVLKGSTPDGQEFSVKKTVGEWRDEMRENGIIIDDLDLSDAIQTGRTPRHLRTSFTDPLTGKFRAPAYTTMAGAAAGGIAGYATGDDEDRVRRAMAGIMFGGIGGLSGGGAMDLFLRRPVGAALEAIKRGDEPWVWNNPQAWKNLRPAFSAGFDAWIDLIGGTNKESFTKALLTTETGKAAVGLGIAGGVGGAVAADEDKLMSGLKAGAFAALFGGTTKAFADGAFILSGGIGRKIEEQSKIVNYLAGRRKGMSASAASDIVQKTLFDYDDLTTFERYVLRRVFPFYTWTSKNATELQPWLLQNRPLAYAALTRTVDALDTGFELDEDKRLLDEHLRYRVIFASGTGRVVAGFGLPQEDLIQMFKGAKGGVVPTGLASYIHPALQLVYKFITGKDPYYNVDLKRVTSARDVRYLPEFFKKYLGYHEKEVSLKIRGETKTYTSYQIGRYFNEETGEPQPLPELAVKRMALLKSSGAGRLVAELTKILTPTFMSGVHGSEEGAEATEAERFFAVLSGLKPYGTDIKAGGISEERMYRAFEKELDKALDARNERLDISVIPTKLPQDKDSLDFLRDLGTFEQYLPEE